MGGFFRKMEKYSFIIGDKDRGLRLDRFLASSLPKDVSRSFVQNLIKKGNVLVNGAGSKAHHLSVVGDIIEVVIPEPVAPAVKSEDLPIDIIYEDGDLLVVYKPAGMVVHPAPGNYEGTLVGALMHHCKDKLSAMGGPFRPGIVHRLDKDTSGLLVVAKNDASHRHLAGQFKEHSIKRIYVALVKGAMQFDNGVIDLPIGRSSRDRKKMGVKFVDSRDAVTRYKVLKRLNGYTLIELSLGTGRTHQIRVHMSYLGNPILGDVKYGAKGIVETLALHAKTLGFVHPRTLKYMEFDSEVPEFMVEFTKERS